MVQRNPMIAILILNIYQVYISGYIIRLKSPYFPRIGKDMNNQNPQLELQRTQRQNLELDRPPMQYPQIQSPQMLNSNRPLVVYLNDNSRNEQLTFIQKINRTLGSGKKMSMILHPREFFATILLIFGWIMIFGEYVVIGGELLGIGPKMALALMIYIIYLNIVLLSNRTANYVWNVNKGEDFESQSSRIQNTSGFFTFTAYCYHQIVHTKTTRTHMSDGTTNTSTSRSTERVVTNNNSTKYYPSSFSDNTVHELQHEGGKKFFFIRNILRYNFASTQDQNCFIASFNSYKNRNQTDINNNIDWRWDWNQHTERQTFSFSNWTKAFQVIFFVSAVIALIWPYVLFMECIVERRREKYVKIICCDLR